MRNAAFASLLAWGLLAGTAARATRAPSSPRRTPTTPISDRALRAATRRGGVVFEAVARPFTVKRDAYSFSPRPPDPKELESFEVILLQELSLYPRDFFRKAGLKRVVLGGENVYVDAKGAAAGVDGLAETVEGTLYLDVGTKYNDGIQARQTLHHELFHFFDAALHGTAMDDPDWEALNPDGFAYHQIADTQADNRAFGSEPGFLCPYAMTKANEDRAETYGDMIAYPDLVAARAAADPIVKRKVDYLKRELSERAGIGPAFWSKVAGRHLEYANTQSLAAYEKIAGKNVESLRLYVEAAEEGDSNAMFMAGYSYLHGRGSPADPEQAFRWLLKSAKAGNKFGEQAVGYFYEAGIGTPKDPAEARRWYKLSSAQGFADADAGLARLANAAAP